VPHRRISWAFRDAFLQDRPSRLRKTLVECRASDYALKKKRGRPSLAGIFEVVPGDTAIFQQKKELHSSFLITSQELSNPIFRVLIM
jgi:hypothetical protein